MSIVTGVDSTALDRIASSRTADLVAFALAVIGALIGAYVLVLHLTTDPAADVHAYYEAGARLNAGQPLYEQSASTAGSHYYLYPPLLAVAFRPLALLPFEVAAAIWMLLLFAALAGSIWLAGVRNRWTWYVLGWLAAPIAWSLVIGQAHILVMYLLTLATPLGLALAGRSRCSLRSLPCTGLDGVTGRCSAGSWRGASAWRRCRSCSSRAGRSRS